MQGEERINVLTQITSTASFSVGDAYFTDTRSCDAHSLLANHQLVAHLARAVRDVHETDLIRFVEVEIVGMVRWRHSDRQESRRLGDLVRLEVNLSIAVHPEQYCALLFTLDDRCQICGEIGCIGKSLKIDLPQRGYTAPANG